MFTDLEELHDDPCQSQSGQHEEDFVQVSSSHIESSPLSIVHESIHLLKQLSLTSTEIQSTLETRNIEPLLDDMNQTISSLLEKGEALHQQAESMVSNLRSIQKQLLVLNEDVVSLSKVLENQAMKQRLEWALSNFETIADELNWDDSYDLGFYRKTSNHILKKILLAFRKGEGIEITSYDKNIRESIYERVHDLIGQKPRLCITEKRYTLFIS